MNNHEYYEELVSLKADGMLSAEQESELNAHLEACSECRERLEIYLTIRILSDELLEEPPDNFTSSVMYKVGLEKKQNSLKRHLTARIFTLAGAAAAIALLVYSGAFKTLINPQRTAGGYDSADIMAAAPSTASGAQENGSDMDKALTMDQMQTDAGAKAESAPAEAAPTESPAKAPGLFGFTGKASAADNTFDPSAVNVGDVIAGFEITEMTAVEESNVPSDARIVFEGETTLSGTLYFDNDDNARWGKFIYFYVDDDSTVLLPYPINDDRQVWFGIDNYDEAVRLLDIQPEDEGKTIAYRSMIVIDSYTVVQGSSEGCNFASLKSIASIDRLSD